MKKICIAGYGYVGKAFYEFFKSYKHYEVFAYDISKDIQKDYDFVSGETDILNNVDLVVICAPTPSKKDGSVNISCVEDILNHIEKKTLVLIKSTIPPTTTSMFQQRYPHLRIVFSPEYIGESNYYFPHPYDFNSEVIKSSYFIFGGDYDDTSEIVDIFQKIAGPVKEYIQTNSLDAEICKYMENTFFATKIIFCNEFYNICKQFGANYNNVRELWLKDPRITKTHTAIYNKTENECFGGKCLPKDLAGIIFHSKQAGYNPQLLEQVKVLNIKIKNPNNILMIHRVYYDKEQKISPLYFDRDMVISYEKLKNIIEKYLEKGFKFGGIKECLENPNKYFCLSFDDGFKEHLWVARDLVKTYSIKKEALLFAINVGNSIYYNFSGMDIIYHLAESNILSEAFEFFNLKISNNSLLTNIQKFKEHYMKQSPKILSNFYNRFSVNLESNFLNKGEIKELAKISTICSHGITHRDLTYHIEQSKIEIVESKKVLEEIVGDKIDTFVYPEGKSDDILYNFFSEYEYTYCLSISNRKNNNFCIGRNDVKNYCNNCNE